MVSDGLADQNSFLVACSLPNLLASISSYCVCAVNGIVIFVVVVIWTGCPLLWSKTLPSFYSTMNKEPGLERWDLLKLKYTEKGKS